MKNSESLRKLLHAMNAFSAAHLDLLNRINDYERLNNADVNAIPGFMEAYPFGQSLDDVKIQHWVESVIEGVRKATYKVLSYNYLNTGGNTMVGVFEVWLPARNRVVYVMVNEEGAGMTTVDYISHDIEIDDFDEVTLDNVNWERMTVDTEFFELYRYCLNEYTKSECRYFGCTRAIPYRLLSDKLQGDVSAEYLAWCEENNQCCVPTDGFRIVEHDDYIPPVRDFEKMLKDIKDFKDWHDATAGNEELYPHDYIITLAGRTCRIPYDATAFSHIDELLEDAIEEW